MAPLFLFRRGLIFPRFGTMSGEKERKIVLVVPIVLSFPTRANRSPVNRFHPAYGGETPRTPQRSHDIQSRSQDRLNLQADLFACRGERHARHTQ